MHQNPAFLNFLKRQINIENIAWKRLPKEVIVLDIETFNTNFKNHSDTRIKIIGVKLFIKKNATYEDTSYIYFKESQIEEFVAFLNSYPLAKILGHNSKSFDLEVLRYYLSPTVSRRLIVDSIDTLLCLRFIFRGFPAYKGEMTLDSLGIENFGMGKVKIESSIVDLTDLDYTQQLLDYNERDLELTFMLWFKMISEFEISIKGTGPVSLVEPFKTLKSGKQLRVGPINSRGIENRKENVIKVLTGEVVMNYDHKSISWSDYKFSKKFISLARGESIRYKLVASSSERFRLEINSQYGGKKIVRCEKVGNRWLLISELVFFTEEENNWRLVDNSRKKIKGDISVRLELDEDGWEQKYEYFPKVHTQSGNSSLQINLQVFKSYIHE